MEYRLIRSSRRTISLKIDETGALTVYAPKTAPKKDIDDVVERKKEWIEEKTAEVLRSRGEALVSPFTDEDIRAMAEEALRVIPERVKYYAGKLGVTYGKITIRNQKTKWGSCSSAGNLNFNCLLMKTPPEVLDSVVVHELCHRLEMNHSPKFYSAVLSVFPDYYECDRWLKENGRTLLMRMIL